MLVLTVSELYWHFHVCILAMVLAMLGVVLCCIVPAMMHIDRVTEMVHVLV